MSRFVGWYESVKVGTPADPDPALYEKLSEEERMLGGWPYGGSFPVKGHVNTPLDEQRFRAQQLFAKYNDTKAEQHDLREEILGELLHESCKDKVKMIEPPFVVDYGRHLKVGNNFYCNFGCLILDSAMVEIGDNCLIGPGVHIYTACHPVNPEHRKDFLQNPIPESYQELARPVKIGNQCWIGGRAVICPGVTIGNNVTIGAGAVVTKDVPCNVVIGGNPAKIIRYLDGADVPQEVLELQKKNEKKQPTKEQPAKSQPPAKEPAKDPPPAKESVKDLPPPKESAKDLPPPKESAKDLPPPKEPTQDLPPPKEAAKDHPAAHPPKDHSLKEQARKDHPHPRK